jgi:antitoxin CptB
MTDRAHITDRTDDICRTDARRRRVQFRSWRRGTQEVDLLLGSFADDFLAGFDGAQLDRFEALLDRNDVELLDWITGRHAPPREYDHDVMRLPRTSHFRLGFRAPQGSPQRLRRARGDGRSDGALVASRVAELVRHGKPRAKPRRASPTHPRRRI